MAATCTFSGLRRTIASAAPSSPKKPQSVSKTTLSAASGAAASRRSGHRIIQPLSTQCQHPTPSTPREARLSSDYNPHSRRLHIQSLDAVAQRERLAYLGARVGLHDVSVDQEVEHTSLDGDA